MNAKILLIGSLGFLLGTAAIANQPAPAAQVDQGSTQGLTDQKSASALAAGDEVKCRPIKVTGSLVKRGKVCKTVAEWERLRERGNSVAREFVDHSRTRPSGQ